MCPVSSLTISLLRFKIKIYFFSAPILPLTVPITVDKSILVSLGEKLYAEKIDFMRELVNNAYDADAARVDITLIDGDIVIEDDGSGMNLKGLSQYFTLGSQEKRFHAASKVFGRVRIGEFGIGKFAALAVCDTFIIETQQGDFRGSVSFSKKLWDSENESWDLPITTMEAYPFSPHWTKITLKGVVKTFTEQEILRHLRDKVPLGSRNFQVFLNQKEVTPLTIAGRRFSVEFLHVFGKIAGEIVVTKQIQKDSRAGLAIRVKGVTIQYDYFGMESSPVLGNGKLHGSLYADFLPITSNCDSCIRDSQEFLAFTEFVQKFLKEISKKLTNEKLKESDTRSSEQLKEALQMIGKAIRDLPDLFPTEVDTQKKLQEELADEFFGQEEGMETGEGFSVSKPKVFEDDEQTDILDVFAGENDQKKEEREPKNEEEKEQEEPQHTKGTKAIARRLRLKNLGIICRLEHLGEDREESFMDQKVMFINLDNPMFLLMQKNERDLSQYMMRLITKEIAIQKHAESSRTAFELQSMLLLRIAGVKVSTS